MTLERRKIVDLEQWLDSRGTKVCLRLCLQKEWMKFQLEAVK